MSKRQQPRDGNQKPESEDGALVTTIPPSPGTPGKTTPQSPPSTPTSFKVAKFSHPGTPQTPLQSPSSKGKGESLKGYILAVGTEDKTKKGKSYFIVSMQISKKTLIAIQVLDDGHNDKRAMFLPHLNKAVTFVTIYPGDSCYFYTRSTGSRVRALSEPLQFAKEYLKTPVDQLVQKNAGLYHVLAALKWLTEIEVAKNGGNYRNAMIADSTGHIKMTIWKESWWTLQENVYYMPHLQLKDSYGKILATQHSSCFQLIGSADKADIAPFWPADLKDQIETDTTVSIDSVVVSVMLFSHAICPGCKVRLDITSLTIDKDNFVDCTCGRMFQLKLFEISGTIDLEVDNNEMITLSLNNAVIDETFGEGTCKVWGLNVKEIKKMFLRLQHVRVRYTTHTQKVIEITELEEIALDDDGK